MRISIKDIAKKTPGVRPMYRALRFVYLHVRYVYGGGRCYCPVCGKNVKKFLEFGQNVSYRFSKITGLGRRKNAQCPACGAVERLRLEYLYLEKTNIFTYKCKVLHVAPEAALSKALRKNTNLEYCSGDIEKGKAMYVVDITDICFEDKSFDFVICNHVLEHIVDENKALAEINRVLKKDGIAVLTVPINSDYEHTFEKPTTSPEERLELFGQDDHVRLYGLDFSERLQNAGFIVETFSAAENVSADLIEQYALPDTEIIYIISKPIEK